MSNGIVHSILFTEALVDEMEIHFGESAVKLAEEITPQKERQQLQSLVQEDPKNAYIKNMQFLIHYLDRLESLYGEKIAQITRELVKKQEHGRWCAVRKETDDHSVKGFIDTAWEPLRALGFAFDVNEKPDGMQINCTACPVHQLSKMIGGAKWLAILECDKDLYNIEAFNPNIKMRRTKTLMKGDTHCDHYYSS